nr:RNA methyltransferase [Aureimonas sp. ME7]
MEEEAALHDRSNGQPRLIDIHDPHDPRIEAYRAVRERDWSRQGRFIAEGSVVLDQLLASTRFRPVSLLLLRARVANLLPRLRMLNPDVPIYQVEGEVFDAIAGFHVHRGVMALAETDAATAERDADAALDATAATGGTVVVACGISNHDNMGAIFRNAAAFGAGAVLLDERACDPLYRKAIRVSVGTVLTLPFARGGTASGLVAMLEGKGFQCLALSPSGPTELRNMGRERPRALFLGAEGEGLEREVMRRCQPVRIAMAPGLDSLNVATSAAIALHHFFSESAGTAAG